jgi:phosphonate metabolism-associated iron-containing alcohol dehydrogenase
LWTYQNPVNIRFGNGLFSSLPELIAGRSFGLVTYSEKPFDGLRNELKRTAGEPLLTIKDIAPNPDTKLLAKQTARFAQLSEQPEVIVALGGGSVIDSAKVFSAASGDYTTVLKLLQGEPVSVNFTTIPIIAVPTTAGTGSEVTCWATVWSSETNRKFSLSRKELYPEIALIDPDLMLKKPRDLTLATALDALSHALESIWNINANPVSARFAVAAAKTILRDLPKLYSALDDLELRSNIAEASLNAGLAFSNTKTAIAHNISYPLTLGWGIKHGIACSFTLPTILQSVIGIGGFRESSLKQIFGEDLSKGADHFTSFLKKLGVGHRFADHQISPTNFKQIIDEAFEGERGKNFIGSKIKFLEAAQLRGVA